MYGALCRSKGPASHIIAACRAQLDTLDTDRDAEIEQVPPKTLGPGNQKQLKANVDGGKVQCEGALLCRLLMTDSAGLRATEHIIMASPRNSGPQQQLTFAGS